MQTWCLMREHRCNARTARHLLQVARHGTGLITPDVLFLDDVVINGSPCRWIDAKNFYGADLPLGRRRTQRQVRHVPCRMNPNASSPETRRPFVFLVHF